MTKQQEAEGGRKVSKKMLNNMIMQMRKNCNHPDLISSSFTNEAFYPDSKELLKQSGKLDLLNRLLVKLKAKGHRVLIFSQVRIHLLTQLTHYRIGFISLFDQTAWGAAPVVC